MPYRHSRRNLRLRGWDYSSPGAYFITVCAKDRLDVFGEIVGGEMRQSEIGEIVANTWRWLPSQYPHVILDEWCVMPDHLHGILVLTDREEFPDDGSTVGDHTEPDGDRDTARRSRKAVGRLIGAFKTVSTKHVNRLRSTPRGMLWQRNFWERVIRDGAALDRIRRYIRENPAT